MTCGTGAAVQRLGRQTARPETEMCQLTEQETLACPLGLLRYSIYLKQPQAKKGNLLSYIVENFTDNMQDQLYNLQDPVKSKKVGSHWRRGSESSSRMGPLLQSMARGWPSPWPLTRVLQRPLWNTLRSLPPMVVLRIKQDFIYEILSTLPTT